MKFVITGGAGFIGSHIVKHLISKNYEVSVVDNFSRGRLENLSGFEEKIEIHKIDILDLNSLKKIISDSDGIFHQAALTSVPESFLHKEKYHNVNVNGTENIFKIAQKFKKKVVYASSSSIYGNTEKIPIEENFQRKPINPYGQTKLEDEFLAEKYTNEGLKVIGLRYFNIFGKGQTGSYAGVITQFIKKLNNKQSPIIFGDGSQIRDFIHVSDIAKANLSAMLSETNAGFFNIGTGKGTKIIDLAKIIIKIFNKQFEPIFQNSLEGDVMISQADMTLANEKLNWKSKIELEKGLEKMIRSY